MMKKTGVKIFILMVFWAVFALAVEVEILRPNYRTGADLLPAIQAAVGGEGQVTLDQRTGALVVSGTPAAIARAKRVLAELDVKPRMVRIEVRQSAESTFTNLGVRIDWTAAAGNWRIGRLRQPSADGDTVVSGEGQARHRLYRSTDATRQMVRVLEGNYALIVSGRKREFSPTNFGWSGFEGPSVSGQVRYVQTGLLARPRIAGEEIYLDVMPQAVVFTAGGRRVQRYHQVKTTVRLRDGETILLAAGSSQSSDLLTDTMRGFDATSGSTSQILLLTVNIESE